MKRIIGTLLSLLCLSSVTPTSSLAADADGAKHVDAAGAAKLLKENPKIVVLDVRTDKEFSMGHIKDAKNIDYMEEGFEAAISKLPKDKTYLVHCASGMRSTKALPVLKKLGFKSIVHMDGGFKAWQKAEQAVEK